jgi:hypothetical protein
MDVLRKAFKWGHVLAARRRVYSLADMRHTLVTGWGKVGGRVADAWEDFNRLYFAGKLKPLPIFLTPSMPYGTKVGWTCCLREVTHIALARPRNGTFLVADRGVLLHEMVHQFLHEQGDLTGHGGEPWRLEIMRLTLAIAGKDIWAGAYTVRKVKGKDGRRRSVRGNLPHPVTGEPSLSQCEITHWPHSLGIDLGTL